ncbi:Ribonucleases P/MRP protein subunit pop1 [Dermatophagoides pteronyssinus]|uniref:Ribonucleases P/MRP protein subunit pop1 n=1 Tax=Dermatophagoides pteronyssinus TaxID=6956 RepID=A0ABQ8IYA6_DERPT|nr:Ribonucleases P/MRP protein subunit pop1 [Dermatophagoides pteronyssinus]
MDIPEEISIYNFIQSHIVEINSLKKQCRTKQCKNVLQRVPRHIRRRAASNNPKRLPKKLQKFLQQPSKTLSNKTLQIKKSSSKIRRIRKRKIRKRNKDSRRTILHMWFTKRFKMEFLWNIFIPWKNNMKNQRILYRGSKKGSVCYYMAFLKTFLLHSSDNNNDNIYRQLSDFISPEGLERLKTISNHHSMNINLYEYQKYPYNLIGPCDVVKIKQNDKLYLAFTGHLLVFDSIIEQFLQHNISLSFEQMNCSCIRLHGSHSSERLSKKLGKKLPTTFEQQNQWQCWDQSINQSSDFSMFFNNLEKEIIAIRQYHFGHYQIETIEILIPNQFLKKIWNKINANMSHLVGGLRDLEVMTIDTDTLLYPRIGYKDCMVNRQEKSNIFDFENKYIIRNHDILTSLNTNHSVDKIVSKIIDPENALIQVMVDYLKGTPKTDDIILVPKSSDYLSKLMVDGHLKSENLTNIDVNNDDDHEPIGLIEFGCFSMRMAHSRAIGIISLQSLEKLFLINQKNQTQLYTLVKTKFNHLKIVKISLIIC